MNKKTILFIEDDKDDLTLALKAFKESETLLNYLVIAYDGSQALEYLMLNDEKGPKQMSFYPDLIILDLELPYHKGDEILRRIRENDYTKNIPVVVFTSSDNINDIAKCYSEGANSFVKKPVQYEEFIDTLQRIVDYWIEININMAQIR